MKIDFKTPNYNTFGKVYKVQKKTQNIPPYAQEDYAQSYLPVPVIRRHQSSKMRLISGARNEAEKWTRNIIALFMAAISLSSVSMINRNIQRNNTTNSSAYTLTEIGRKEEENDKQIESSTYSVLKRSAMTQRKYKETENIIENEITTPTTTTTTKVYEIKIPTGAKPPAIIYEIAEVADEYQKAEVQTKPTEAQLEETPATSMYQTVLPETEEEASGDNANIQSQNNTPVIEAEPQTTGTQTAPTETAITIEAEEPDEEVYYEYISNTPSQDSLTAAPTEAEDSTPLLIAPQETEAQTEPTAVNNVEVLAAEPTQAEKNMYSKGQEYLLNLEYAGGDAWKYFDNFVSQLNMSKEEAMEYLVNLCESENFGNGTIDPIVLCAQIYQESSYDNNCIGDHGKAVGFGQQHPEAVDEVNNKFNTNYTYDDRYNPKKNLEMMVLFMRYCRERVEKRYEGESAKFYIKAALAMYNRGHATGINETGGQNYVYDVLKHLDNHWVK